MNSCSPWWVHKSNSRIPDRKTRKPDQPISLPTFHTFVACDARAYARWNFSTRTYIHLPLPSPSGSFPYAFTYARTYVSNRSLKVDNRRREITKNRWPRVQPVQFVNVTATRGAKFSHFSYFFAPRFRKNVPKSVENFSPRTRRASSTTKAHFFRA